MICDQFMVDTISPMRFSSNRLCEVFLDNNGGMETFASRVRARRKSLHLSQKDLAKKAKLSQTTISDIERGRNDGSRDMVGLARALQCRAEWLETGRGAMDEESPFESNVVAEDRDIRLIPLISWVQAGTFCNAPDLFAPGDAEEWLPAQSRMGKQSYALRVVGDSMKDPHGRVSYWPGMTIFVDPDEPVLNGSHVIAKLPDTDQATFKVYTEDGGQRFLKPLNPQYPTIPMTPDMIICGVVVGVFFSTK